MDAAGIQAKISIGYGKAAARLGFPCRIWRPEAAATPFSRTLGTVLAAFAANPEFTKPQLYGNATWLGVYDGRTTLPGDYLVRLSDGETWFVAAQQSLLPFVCVLCTHRVYISRQPAPGVGDIGYGGLVSPVPVLGNADSPWPASILVGGRTQAGLGVPADVKEAGWRVLLPPSVPIALLAGDILTDENGRRLAVESAELTDLGWRLTVNEVHT